MVPEERLELSWCRHRRILSPLRLPVPPFRPRAARAGKIIMAVDAGLRVRLRAAARAHRAAPNARARLQPPSPFERRWVNRGSPDIGPAGPGGRARRARAQRHAGGE